MFQTIKNIIFGENRFSKPQFDVEKWRKDFDSKNYPESDKYFEAAKKLLEKYPPEEWEIKPTMFLDTKSLKHEKCSINFGAFIYPHGSRIYYQGTLSCAMNQRHGMIIFGMFKPLFDELDAKYKKEQEEKQAQFDAKLAAELSQ